MSRLLDQHLLTGEGLGEEPNNTMARKPVLYNHSILSGQTGRISLFCSRKILVYPPDPPLARIGEGEHLREPALQREERVREREEGVVPVSPGEGRGGWTHIRRQQNRVGLLHIAIYL